MVQALKTSLDNFKKSMCIKTDNNSIAI